MIKTESFNSILNISGQYHNHLLTYQGSLIGVLELSGVDPASTSEEQLSVITKIVKLIFDMLPTNCSMSSYYIHYDGETVSAKEHQNPKVNILLKKRVSFLNNKIGLNGSRLFWVIEIYPDENLNKINSISFYKNLFNSVFDSESRKKIKIALSPKSSYIVEEKALNRLRDSLNALLKDIEAKLSFISLDNQIKTPKELWNLNRFLVNFNKNYLNSKEAVPLEEWDKLLPDGDIKQVIYSGHNLLKINGAKPIYIKIAHILQFGGEEIPFGVWATKKSTPVLKSGDYIYFTRMRKMTDTERFFLFKSKKDALIRSQTSLSSMLNNSSSEEQLLKKMEINPKLKEELKTLEIQRSSDDQYCYFLSSVILFNSNPDILIENIENTNRLLIDNMVLIWENAGALSAYKRIQFGFNSKTYRDFEFTTLQASACTLLYRSDTGRLTWGEYQNEYAYVFESNDKSAFYYNSYVKHKDLTICVGPTRSGKSFVRNVLACHFRKFDGIYVSIDVDNGTETLAKYFNEDSGIFRLPREDEKKAGFNPLQMARSVNDTEWISHFTALVRDLLKLNDSEEMRSFTATEQIDFDKAIIYTLTARDDPNSNTPASLTAVASQAGSTVKNKLKRFLRGGQYGHIFDNDYDAVGILNKPISVYNLSAVKDDLNILGLVQREVFYRIIQLFEDPSLLNVPKKLDMDECKYSFTVKESVNLIEAKVRTWFKHQGSLNLWTQSPTHYLGMEGWETIRASASTFFFMSDHTAVSDYENYNKAFGITIDECKLIASLIPRKQIYIKQPDIGVAKVVNLNVESEQYVICTSTAEEMAIRDEITEKMKDEKDYNNVITAVVNEINKRLNKNMEITEI